MFSVSIRQEGTTYSSSSSGGVTAFVGDSEERVAPFADDSVISILRKHRVQLIFGGESYLPDDFCGLGWVDSRDSVNPHLDFFLQLHLSGPLLTTYSPQEVSDSLFYRYLDLVLSDDSSLLAGTNSGWILCSESESASSSPTCDGQVLLTSLHTARSLAARFKAAYDEWSGQVLRQEAAADTCQLACRFPGKLLLSEEDRLAMMASTLASDPHAFALHSLLQPNHHHQQQQHKAVIYDASELRFDSSSQESLVSTWEGEDEADCEESRLRLSDFTAVTKKFDTDSKQICVMYWPLNNSEVFIFSRSLFTPRKHVVDFRLFCSLPRTVLEPPILQVDFLSDGVVLSPYSVSAVLSLESYLGSIQMAANIPPLRAMNLEPGHVSIRVSLLDSSDNAVIAALAVNIIFKFGSDMQQQSDGSSPPIPSYTHSNMARLTREDFYGLLNGLNLTNVALEVGVCDGEFARNMLSNWHGER